MSFVDVDLAGTPEENAQRELAASDLSVFHFNMKQKLIDVARAQGAFGPAMNNLVGTFLLDGRQGGALLSLNQLLDVGLQVARDESTPVADVRRRRSEVLRSYADTLDQQIRANVTANERGGLVSFVRQVADAFERKVGDLLESGGRLVGRGAKGVADTTGVPMEVWIGLGALGLVAYLVSQLDD